MQKNVLLVGFKAEVKERGFTLEGAKKKLKESASDMIIANDIGTSTKKNNFRKL